jgi:hypothetical protein
MIRKSNNNNTDTGSNSNKWEWLGERIKKGIRQGKTRRETGEKGKERKEQD